MEKSFSVEPYLFLFFIGAQFHVELAKKMRLFYDFLASFAAAVSFIFSEPSLDGFISLATLTHETTASLIFELKNV